jgi:hypothetical protein
MSEARTQKPAIGHYPESFLAVSFLTAHLSDSYLILGPENKRFH